MKSKSYILKLATALLIVNLLSVYFFNLFDSRIVRVVTVGIFLIYFLSLKVKDGLIIVFISLLLIADVLDMFFDQTLFAKLYAIVKVSAYLILLKRLIKKVSFKKFEKGFGLLFGVIVLLNLLIGFRAIYEVSDVIEDNLETTLLVIYGFTIVLVAVCSANYYVRYNSKRAFYFTLFIYLLLFADLSGFIASYMYINNFFYIERAFYIYSLLYCGYYLLLTSEADDNKDFNLKE